MKKYIYSIIKIVLVGIAIYFISNMFLKNLEMIKSYSWQPDAYYLFISFILLVTVFLFFVTGWHLILKTLNVNLPLIEVSRIWILSQFGKYIPGHIWQFVGRITFLSEHGVSKKRGLLSIHLESAASILAATLTLLMSMMLSENTFMGVSMPLIIAAIVLCLVLLNPKVLEIAINTFFKILKRESVKVDYSFKNILIVTSYYMLGWFVLSSSFYFLVKAFYSIEPDIFFDVAFSFTASYVIGFLAIFAPGGIGVREGFLILFLKQTLPEFLTTVISIASRLWFIIGEALSFLIIMGLYQLLKKSKTISKS